MQGSFSSSFEKFSSKKSRSQNEDSTVKRVQGNKHRQERRNKKVLLEQYY